MLRGDAPRVRGGLLETIVRDQEAPASGRPFQALVISAPTVPPCLLLPAPKKGRTKKKIQEATASQARGERRGDRAPPSIPPSLLEGHHDLFDFRCWISSQTGYRQARGKGEGLELQNTSHTIQSTKRYVDRFRSQDTRPRFITTKQLF